MKKLLALLLALVMVMSLCACGAGESSNTEESVETTPTEAEESTNPKMTKEEMLAQAEEHTCDWLNEIAANTVRAEQDYEGKIVLLTAQVENIDKEYIYIGGLSSDVKFRVKAHLPQDEIVKINSKQLITVVGRMGKIENDEKYFDMPEAYLVNDRFEYEVQLRLDVAAKEDDRYNVLYSINDKDYFLYVAFRDNNLPNVENKSIIKISAIVFTDEYGFPQWDDTTKTQFYDAVVID